MRRVKEYVEMHVFNQDTRVPDPWLNMLIKNQSFQS